MSTATMSVARKAREAGSRVGAIDWSAVSADLDAQGWAVMPKLLIATECGAVAGRYDQDQGFRSHIVMARHGFGRGEYKYLVHPGFPGKAALILRKK